MEQSTLVQALQHCDSAIEQLRQAQERPDVALALLDARMLLLQPASQGAWDQALVRLLKDGA